MIYMRGLKEKDLVAIVDFVYQGETNINQNDLDGFLALAEELQLEGLAGFKEIPPDSTTKKATTPKSQRPPKIKQESLYESKFTNLKSDTTESTCSLAIVETKK